MTSLESIEDVLESFVRHGGAHPLALRVEHDETGGYRDAAHRVTVTRGARQWLHPSPRREEHDVSESGRDVLAVVAVLTFVLAMSVVVALAFGGYLDADTSVLALLMLPVGLLVFLAVVYEPPFMPAPRWQRRAGRSVTLTPGGITVRSEGETIDILPAQIGVVRVDPDGGRFAVVVARANVSRCVMDALSPEEARGLARLVGNALARPVSLAAGDVATRH